MRDADRTLAVFLAEYNDLRTEIHQRVNNQLLIMGGEVALLAAFIPILQPVIERGTPLPLLLAPILFAIVAWLYLEQDLFIVNTARYIHQRLRPAITSCLGDESPASEQVLQWEDFRNEHLFRAESVLLRLSTLFRIAATLGPGVVSLAVGIYHAEAAHDRLGTVSWAYRALGLLGATLLAGDVWLGARCAAGYQAILGDAAPGDDTGDAVVIAPD